MRAVKARLKDLWRARSITEIGELVDSTEEKNTDEVLSILDRLMG